MKFVKLRLHNVPSSGGKLITEDSWNMVIDNPEDLFKYAKLDTELYANAMLKTQRLKDGTFEVGHGGDVRTQTVATMLNIKMFGAKEGEKFYPLIEVSNLCDKKTQGMLKYILNHGAIRVNEFGGYCGYECFVETWNAEVLQVVEKESLGFPIETEVLNAETIILENQDRVYSEFRRNVEVITGGKAQAITMMKEKDGEWVIKSILNAKNIAFESQLMDDGQMDKFMEIFSKMPRKRVIISMYDHIKPKLTNHPLWKANNARHEILFV